MGLDRRLEDITMSEFVEKYIKEEKDKRWKDEDRFNSFLHYLINYVNKHYRVLSDDFYYNEDGHKNYTYEQQEGRQKEIEQELGCKFIRVSDEDNLFYNIGLVIKTIYEMDHNKCDDCGCNMSLYGGEYTCGNCGYVKKYNPTTMFL